MLMLAFRIPIMLRSVGRCSETGYTMGHKEGPKIKIATREDRVEDRAED